MHTSNGNFARTRIFGSDIAPCPFSSPVPGANQSITEIRTTGDVMLHFRDDSSDLNECYRCSRNVLRRASPYFEVLFDPVKFREGSEVERRLRELSEQYSKSVIIPTFELPTIVIQDAGELPARDGHRKPALTLFLKILHNAAIDECAAIDEWSKDPTHVLTIVTLLSIIAERFQATKLVTQHVKRQDKKIFEDRKRERGARQIETNKRQRLLTGMILGFPDWVRQSSAALICDGSERWIQEANLNTREDERNSEPLWWRLPHGMEEELQCRREYVLETTSSLPSHFLKLYTSKQLQCKLGYDTSPQCDSFQLGEMIRFFTRKELLQLQSTYSPSQDPIFYAGDVNNIIEKLRQCPSYQLDRNHGHCGLRTRLLPLLDTLWPNGHVGICLKCWDDDKIAESWLETPTRGTWAFSKGSIMRWENCQQHRQLKAMYSAEERDWMPSLS